MENRTEQKETEQSKETIRRYYSVSQNISVERDTNTKHEYEERTRRISIPAPAYCCHHLSELCSYGTQTPSSWLNSFKTSLNKRQKCNHGVKNKSVCSSCWKHLADVTVSILTIPFSAVESNTFNIQCYWSKILRYLYFSLSFFMLLYTSTPLHFCGKCWTFYYTIFAWQL